MNDPEETAERAEIRRKETGYTITLEHMKYVEELAELMNAITNSDRFSSIPKITKEKGEKALYTLMFDEAEARGEARGEIKGAIKEAVKFFMRIFMLPR